MDVKLKTPLSRRDTSKLNIKDVVYVSGIIYTARDSAHKRIVEEGSPVNLEGTIIFHAGPVIKITENPDNTTDYHMVAIGPTTSGRMNPYEPKLIDDGVKAVIGKGGMDDETLNALRENGAVFLAAVGGCAALYTKSIKKVHNVYWLDLGIPEAIWELEVKDFGPLFVTMDSHGGNLYEQVRSKISSRRIH